MIRSSVEALPPHHALCHGYVMPRESSPSFRVMRQKVATRPNLRHLLPIQANFLRIACRLYSRLLSHSEPLLSMQQARELKWPQGDCSKERFFDFLFHISDAMVTGLSVTPSCTGKLSHRPGVTLAAAANWIGDKTDCSRFNAPIEGGSAVRFRGAPSPNAHELRGLHWCSC